MKVLCKILGKILYLRCLPLLGPCPRIHWILIQPIKNQLILYTTQLKIKRDRCAQNKKNSIEFLLVACAHAGTKETNP